MSKNYTRHTAAQDAEAASRGARRHHEVGGLAAYGRAIMEESPANPLHLFLLFGDIRKSLAAAVTDG